MPGDKEKSDLKRMVPKLGGWGEAEKVTPYKIDRTDEPWPPQPFPGDNTKIDILPDPWPPHPGEDKSDDSKQDN